MCIRNNITEQSLEKWRILIDACKAYYIDSLPTGISDSEYDRLEKQAAQEDGFFVRDYIFQTYTKGSKAKNHYIDKIKKKKVIGTTMLQALEDKQKEVGENLYFDLKYDGSSIAIYLDPERGVPKKIVTVGNLNLDNFGVDQTWKLMSFLPNRFPRGIVAIQCEALVDLSRFSGADPDTARQKANGLVNSSKPEAQVEVNTLLTLRAYRYYLSDNIPMDSELLDETGCLKDYKSVLSLFEVVKSPGDGHILFAPADTWTLDELKAFPGFTETEKTVTSTGEFLNDGWVAYDKNGVCKGALKYQGAGSGTEAIKTKVLSIQWNSQVSKGKDSWSANVIIEPVQIKGCTVKKPSAGSVGKLIKKNITPGAVVGIIMANSTIPMVGDVFSPGNGDYQWPTCSCGYTMSDKDVYGSLLKCGNPMCSERLDRMRSYIGTLRNILGDLDLNKFLVIDRFKWEDTGINYQQLLGYVERLDESGYHDYLLSFMSTDLQRRNMELVWKASYIVLRETYEKLTRI